MDVSLNIGGHVVLVDESDMEMLSKRSWHITTNRAGLYYVRNAIAGRMHRFILGVSDARLVDHINRNTLDNRRSNLRICTKTESNRNRRGGGKHSQYKGVNKSPPNRWGALMKYEGKNIWLGSFIEEQDAALAYDKAARQYHGEFAYLNFPSITSL